MDWYPWYPTLYKADTLNLTLEQDGAYRRLIDHYMESRAPLPDDEVSLARIVGIDIKHFQAIAEPLLGKFRAKAGLLHHKRCDIELNRQDKLSKKMSKIAKAAAQKRKENNPLQAKAGLEPSQSSHTRQDKTVKDKEEAKASKKNNPPKEIPLLPNLDSRGENAKPAKPRKRKTGISETWQPDEQDHAFAAKKGNSESQITTLADKFRNHHVARATIFINWNAAWRTWVSNDIEFHGQPESRNAQSKRGLGNAPGGNKGFAAYAAEVAAEFEGSGLGPEIDGIYGNRGGDIHSDIKFGSDNGPVTPENTGPGVDEIGNVDQAKRQRH